MDCQTISVAKILPLECLLAGVSYETGWDRGQIYTYIYMSQPSVPMGPPRPRPPMVWSHFRRNTRYRHFAARQVDSVNIVVVIAAPVKRARLSGD